MAVTVYNFLYILFASPYLPEKHSAIKENEMLLFATTWVDLEGIMLKWNKSHRERQILYDITSVGI